MGDPGAIFKVSLRHTTRSFEILVTCINWCALVHSTYLLVKLHLAGLREAGTQFEVLAVIVMVQFFISTLKQVNRFKPHGEMVAVFRAENTQVES